jgi:glutathione S-transferase
MAEYTIVIGNKRYSSWSMRPWLVLRHLGVELDEMVIPLRRPDTRATILQHSPTGKVPVLKHGPLAVWDSLAICEYLAEQFPEAGLWPVGSAARTTARSVVAEMHAGFPILRANMPFDCTSSRPGDGRAPGIEEEIARIISIWEICRHCFGNGGDLLFGARFTIADAFHAPVVSRFRTYGVAASGAAAAYMEAIWSLPMVREWVEAAAAEPWTIDW